MQCNMRKEIEEENQQLRGQYDAAASVVAELQAQLSAIGAGGVESLRKREGLQQSAALFDAIAHGNDGHKAWLKSALDAWFTGQPIPTEAATPAPMEGQKSES